MLLSIVLNQKAYAMKNTIHFMIRAFSICAFALLFSGISNAQVMWQHHYGTPEHDDFGRWAIPNMWGGYSFVGHTKSWGAGDFDILFVEVDTCGIMIKSTIVRDKYTEKGRHLVEEPDGGDIWLTGKSNTVSHGSQDVRVFNLTSASGHSAGSGSNIGGTSADNGFAIQNTSDGGRIVSGMTRSYGGGSADLYLMKLDPAGTLMWAKAYGGTGNEMGNMVRETIDGGFIVTGHSKSYSGDGTKDVYLLKTDAFGVPMWAKTYGSLFGGIDDAYDVRQTVDSGYVVTGYMNMDAGMLSGGAPAGVTSNDVFLMKTDAAGMVTWIQFYTQFPPAVSLRDIGRSVVEVPGGLGYGIAGYTESFSVFSFDGFLILTDPFGVPAPGASWLYGTPEFDDKIFSLEWSPAYDGGWLMCGHTNSHSAGADYDAWLLRAAGFGGTGCDMQVQWNHELFEINEHFGAVSESGGGQIPRTRTRNPIIMQNTFCTDCGIPAAKFGQDISQDITEEMASIMSEPAISMYPNPTNNLLNIEIRGEQDQSSLVRVFDMTGKMIMDLAVEEYRTAVLSLDHLPNGTYVVQVLNNEVSKTERILVQH